MSAGRAGCVHRESEGTHVELAVHQQLDSALDRLLVRVAGRDEAEDRPRRLDDLGSRVLAVDAEDARLRDRKRTKAVSLVATKRRRSRARTDHVRLSPTAALHLLLEQEGARPANRVRVGVRLAGVGERLEGKVGGVWWGKGAAHGGQPSRETEESGTAETHR